MISMDWSAHLAGADLCLVEFEEIGLRGPEVNEASCICTLASSSRPGAAGLLRLRLGAREIQCGCWAGRSLLEIGASTCSLEVLTILLDDRRCQVRRSPAGFDPRSPPGSRPIDIALDLVLRRTGCHGLVLPLLRAGARPSGWGVAGAAHALAQSIMYGECEGFLRRVDGAPGRIGYILAAPQLGRAAARAAETELASYGFWHGDAMESFRSLLRAAAGWPGLRAAWVGAVIRTATGPALPRPDTGPPGPAP